MTQAAKLDPSDLIERIQRMCEGLVEIAPWWAGSWAPVPPGDLAAFEQRHQITLPSGYRRLIREIGEHAPIPGRPRGHVLGLSEALTSTTASEFLGSLDQPFAGADAEFLEWDDETDELADPAPLAGCLPVVDGGCDLTYLLVVTGPDRGRVWSFAPNRAPQLSPTGAEFLAWYAAELERGLAPLEAEAAALAELERRVAADPADFEASVALGRRLLLRDRPRARALLEPAFAVLNEVDAELSVGLSTELRRAIAELDLLDRRRDRIEALATSDDDWLRTYAGIQAAQAGEHRRAIERLESVAAAPVLLRAAATGHLAAAHAALGRPKHALALLRSTQASASNHALAARLRTELGDRDAALRSWREALATADRSRTGPRPPTLADFVEIPVPDIATIAAAIRELEAQAG